MTSIPFVSRAFPIYHERVKLDLRAEAFNVLTTPTSSASTEPMATATAPLDPGTAAVASRRSFLHARCSFWARSLLTLSGALIDAESHS